MSRVVRKARPFRWEVMRPFESSRGRPSRVRITERNWYSSRFPSTAMVRPRSALRVVGWRTTIGVSRTPIAPDTSECRVILFAAKRTRTRATGRLASRGRRREGPSVAVCRDRLEQRQRLGLREAEKELAYVLAQVLPGEELPPVLAVVDDRAGTGIELDAVLFHTREDGLAIPRDLDVSRIQSLRAVEAVPVHEPLEGRLNEGVLRNVRAKVFERQRPQPHLGGCRHLPEPIDALQSPGVFLCLDPKHPQDLKAVPRRVPVEVVVEESVDGLGLTRDLLHPGDPFLELLLRVPVVVPRIRPVAVPPQVRKGGRDVQVRRQERFIDDRVCDAGRLQEVERFQRHPGLVPRLKGERERSRENVKEAMDGRLLEPEPRRELQKEGAELAGVE